MGNFIFNLVLAALSRFAFKALAASLHTVFAAAVIGSTTIWPLLTVLALGIVGISFLYFSALAGTQLLITCWGRMILNTPTAIPQFSSRDKKATFSFSVLLSIVAAKVALTTAIISITPVPALIVAGSICALATILALKTIGSVILDMIEERRRINRLLTANPNVQDLTSTPKCFRELNARKDRDRQLALIPSSEAETEFKRTVDTVNRTDSKPLLALNLHNGRNKPNEEQLITKLMFELLNIDFIKPEKLNLCRSLSDQEDNNYDLVFNNNQAGQPYDSALAHRLEEHLKSYGEFYCKLVEEEGGSNKIHLYQTKEELINLMTNKEKRWARDYERESCRIL